ncbi:hypothetical protein FIBSPDRAFT_892431 [Athelia psychrophila]|uniref:Uncharacterized protein n=1 Tax=Athelia psychrophila TaxID=1759441 RepID=A0A166II80_9AGAM|nr:hypothetical protein FIBSPDRAFT_892431 [Fibularhizoctonia sp. CBS 109695]
MWFMGDQTYEGWQNLEVALVAITQELLQFSRVTLPTDWQWFPLPSKYNYQCGHLGKEKFLRSILLARDAFIPLMAHCSFAIAMTREFRKENPPWARRLMDIGIRPSFVQELQVSQVADFSAHHMGTFIRENCHMQPYIDSTVKPSPAPALIESALAQLDVVNVPSATEEPRPSQRPFPPLPLHSHQHVGETLHDFIARSAKKCEEMNQARRHNRERAQAMYQLPGRGGPAVRLDSSRYTSVFRRLCEGNTSYNGWYNLAVIEYTNFPTPTFLNRVSFPTPSGVQLADATREPPHSIQRTTISILKNGSTSQL